MGVCDVYEIKFSFNYNIVVGFVWVWVSLVIFSDGGIDEVWINFLKRVIIYVIFF